jgi:hypothetical protein
MAEEKPTPEGQPGTQVEEPEVLEMTEQELAHRIDTDPEFANAYLKGDVTVEDSAPTGPDAPEAKTEEPAAPAEAPAEPAPAPKTPEPEAKKDVITPTDDGNFVVEFEDGSKLAYKSKAEALKGIREKENWIRRAKVTLNESKAREQQLSERIKQLESSRPPAAAPQEPAAKKADEKLETKASEELDPFDPEYQKKLAEKVKAQEEMIRRLEKRFEDDRKEHK